MLSATTRGPAIARAGDHGCEVPATRTDRPTASVPACSEGIPVHPGIPCMLVAHKRAAPTLRRIPWLDAALLPGAPTRWIRCGWCAMRTGRGRSSHHLTALPSIGTPDAAHSGCFRCMMAVLFFFFFFFFGGYQGNTRVSENPWEQAYKHSS